MRNEPQEAPDVALPIRVVDRNANRPQSERSRPEPPPTWCRDCRCKLHRTPAYSPGELCLSCRHRRDGLW